MEPANISEPAILLCVNRNYHVGMTGVDLYDVTRGVWAAKGERRSRVKLAFAVFYGKIVGVYQIEQWHLAGTTAYSSGREIDFSKHCNDWEFSGTAASSEIRTKYIEGRIPDRFYGNPVRYVNV